MEVSRVLVLVLSTAALCHCTSIFALPPAPGVPRRCILCLIGKAMETSCQRTRAKQCSVSVNVDSLLSLFFTPSFEVGSAPLSDPTKALLCRKGRSVFRVSSAFKGVICFWCMQDAPSRSLC